MQNYKIVMATIGGKFLNTLTPALVLTSHDECLSLLHFWRYHLLAKIGIISTLEFHRRKRSFQWYPDQSYCLNGAWYMHENAQKIIWVDKLAAKFPATTLSYSMVKMACLAWWCFLRNIWAGSKLKVSHWHKKIGKWEKERAKKKKHRKA